MKTKITLQVLVVVGLAVAATPAAAQTTVGTEFTYQGQLKDGDLPVRGSVDLQFKLFPAASGGTQIGTTQTHSGANVANGLFSVELDFGPTTFTLEARWLEVAVRNPAGTGSFTTLSPRQKLNTTPYAAFALSTPGGVTDGHSLDAADGSPPNAVFVDNVGNVGVGTTSPQMRLHVRANPDEGVRFDGAAVGAANTVWLSFNDADGTPIGYVGDGSSGDDSMYLTSYVRDVHIYTGTGAALTAKADGYVGIGTTNPVGKLHVAGEPYTYGGTLMLEGATHSYIAFFPEGAAAGRKAWFGFGGPHTSELTLWNDAGGNINLVTLAGAATRVNVLEIAGADLAEKFPASEQLEPGMVVAIDPENPGKLCLARGAYNRRVAGIVSGANEFTVGAVLGTDSGAGDGPPIALSGRVYVRCDAANGPIEPGDPLTTSDTPGHAMRADDRDRSHGAILGKAMSRLEQGAKGLVLVLVNLQ